MRLRYGMRLGRGLWVSGGFGIVVAYFLSWMLAAALATALAIGLLSVFAIGLASQFVITKRRLLKEHQTDVALFRRIAAQKVEQVKLLSSGRTNPQALWGVYLIEPSCGLPYVKCGPHAGTLRKLQLENRCGTVHELMLLPDKPMAVALLDLLQRGVCKVKPEAASIGNGAVMNGMPILRNVQS